MSDIIIRIPEKQVAHFLSDKLSSDFAFWRFTRKPRKLNKGDYLFFTLPQGTVFACQVDRIVSAEDDSDDFNPYTTDLPGNWNAIWNGQTTVKFDPPIKVINYAHQGYRYLTRSEQKKLRARFN